VKRTGRTREQLEHVEDELRQLERKVDAAAHSRVADRDADAKAIVDGLDADVEVWNRYFQSVQCDAETKRQESREHRIAELERRRRALAEALARLRKAATETPCT
jgi:hypothetical protein